MGTYIVIAILFIMFLTAVFIIANLDDKLHEKEKLVKNLLNGITALQAILKQNGIDYGNN